MTDPLFGEDKAQHLLISFSVSVILAVAMLWLHTALLIALVVSSFVTILIGVGKEAWDSRSLGCFSIPDIIADLIGIAIGLTLVVL